METFTRALKSIKIGTFMASSCQSWKFISLKFTGELCVMTMNNDAKIEEELTCQLKIDMRNLNSFDVKLKIHKNVLYNRLILTKVYSFWDKKVHFRLWLIAALKVQIFNLVQWLLKNVSHFSCQFWTDKSIPLQILHHFLLSWHITPL